MRYACIKKDCPTPCEHAIPHDPKYRGTMGLRCCDLFDPCGGKCVDLCADPLTAPKELGAWEPGDPKFCPFSMANNVPRTCMEEHCIAWKNRCLMIPASILNEPL